MSNRQNLSVVRSEYMRTGGHSISEKSQKKNKDEDEKQCLHS